MQEYLKFYINGEWIDPVALNTMEVINPATEEAFAKLSMGSKADVDKAVSAAKNAFPTYSNWSVDDRVALLEKIADLCDRRFVEIAEIITPEMGTSITFSIEEQTPMGSIHFRNAADVLKKFQFEKEDNGVILRYEPIGVCGLITPWNWPINQVVVKAAPALAAGCTVGLKPSELAPND